MVIWCLQWFTVSCICFSVLEAMLAFDVVQMKESSVLGDM